jgi:hypothetical protein
MSGVVLPTSTASAAAQWQLADWIQPQASSPPAAAGLATIELDQLDPDVMWLVDRAVVACTSTAKTAVRFYDTSVMPLALLDGSAAGNFDVTEYPQGLLVRPSRSLVAQWTGATAGAIATVTLQARVYRRV